MQCGATLVRDGDGARSACGSWRFGSPWRERGRWRCACRSVRSACVTRTRLARATFRRWRCACRSLLSACGGLTLVAYVTCLGAARLFTRGLCWNAVACQRVAKP